MATEHSSYSKSDNIISSPGERFSSAIIAEQTKKVEKISPRPAGSIIISGEGGRGTSEGARRLSTLLKENGIPVRGIHMVGERSRELYKKRTGKIFMGAYDRDPEIDKKIDERTRRLVKNASPENGLIIIEGQNAAVNAYIAQFDAQRRGERIAPSASFLFVCDPEVAGQRVWNREREKALDRGEEFTLTVEEMIENNRARHENDLQYWWQSVPFLGANRTDPHDKYDKNARELYDGVIDTTSVPPEYVAMQMFVSLLERGLVTIPDNHNFIAPTPSEAT